MIILSDSVGDAAKDRNACRFANGKAYKLQNGDFKTPTAKRKP